MIQIEVSTHVDASPEKVWALIGDPTRMGEWSPECDRASWVGGSTAPVLGAKFKGHNKNGWHQWTTTNTLVAYEPGRELAWDVSLAVFSIARWGYRIEPAEAGCTVVESFVDHRNSLTTALGQMARGVKDVETHNRAGMETTLAAIKAAAEG